MRAALVAGLVALGVIAAIVGPGTGTKKQKPRGRSVEASAASQPVRLRPRTLGALSAPEQNAASAAARGGRMVLLGGLTAADVSRADILVLRGGRELLHAQLPGPVHDAAAATVRGTVYLFGGGDTGSSNRILRVNAFTGRARPAGRLPRPLSDIAAAAVGGTAYIVGGYDGTKASDGILAWRPGRKARRVG